MSSPVSSVKIFASDIEHLKTKNSLHCDRINGSTCVIRCIIKYVRCPQCRACVASQCIRAASAPRPIVEPLSSTNNAQDVLLFATRKNSSEFVVLKSQSHSSKNGSNTIVRRPVRLIVLHSCFARKLFPLKLAPAINVCIFALSFRPKRATSRVYIAPYVRPTPPVFRQFTTARYIVDGHFPDDYKPQVPPYPKPRLLPHFLFSFFDFSTHKFYQLSILSIFAFSALLPRAVLRLPQPCQSSTRLRTTAANSRLQMYSNNVPKRPHTPPEMRFRAHTQKMRLPSKRLRSTPFQPPPVSAPPPFLPISPPFRLPTPFLRDSAGYSTAASVRFSFSRKRTLFYSRVFSPIPRVCFFAAG